MWITLTVFAIASSSLLLLSSMTVASGLDSKSSVTLLTLKPMPAAVYYGEEIRVSGKLIDARTGEGIAHAEIELIDNKPVEQQVLISTTTRKYGLFVAKFTAAPEDPSRDSALYILARFEGSGEYTASVSREQAVTVKLSPLEVRFQYLQKSYSEAETAEIIFTVSSMRKPVEPETIRTSFDGRSVSVTSYGTGNYLYETSPLSKGWHQFFVSVSKPGYTTVSRIITISVS